VAVGECRSPGEPYRCGVTAAKAPPGPFESSSLPTNLNREVSHTVFANRTFIRPLKSDIRGQAETRLPVRSARSASHRHSVLVASTLVAAAFSFPFSTGCGRSNPDTPPKAIEDADVTVSMPDAPVGDSIDSPIMPPSVDVGAAAATDLAIAPQPMAQADPPGETEPNEPVAPSEPADSPEIADSPQPADSPEPASLVETESAAEGDEGQSVTGPEDYHDWPAPQLALVLTGNQGGYIEPCGCTGLENQKGGLARRMTFMRQLQELGWEILPIDAGNQVRRFGRQAAIKFQTTAAGLEEMGYRAVGFGPNDLALGVGELIAAAATTDDPRDGLFVSANVTLVDPELTAQSKTIQAGGRKIGVTSAVEPASVKSDVGGEIEVAAVTDTIAKSLTALNADGADFRVLLFYGEEEAATAAVREVPGFDLVVVAGGLGEPLYRPQAIEGSDTKMIVTGNKGMYAGVVALYPDQPLRYARVAMTHEFEDAPEMRRLMATYQNQLEAIGLSGLGLRPIPHPSDDSFVGTKTCGECHTTALAIWENTPHAHATDSIVNPGERGDVPRHFDPECISCHVTGWNAQNYYPYDSGYLSLEASSHLTGNGCENCHGPGAKHSAAEREGSGVSAEDRDLLRQAIRLPLDKAKDTCLQCHDLDNSPDFHKDGAFEDYWAEVEHYGLD
jgi:hypothetical protein